MMKVPDAAGVPRKGLLDKNRSPAPEAGTTPGIQGYMEMGEKFVR